MPTKTFTTQPYVFRLRHPDAAFLLHEATRIVVTLKNAKTGHVVEVEKPPEMQIVGNRVIALLDAPQTGFLGVGDIIMELSLAFIDGTTLKTKTVKSHIHPAIRSELT